MLWGQKIEVSTGNKNLARNALGFTCDCAYCWRILIEEYGSKTVYIKGRDNIARDVISRLDQDEEISTCTINIHVRNMTLAKLFNGYLSKTTNSKAFQTGNVQRMKHSDQGGECYKQALTMGPMLHNGPIHRPVVQSTATGTMGNCLSLVVTATRQTCTFIQVYNQACSIQEEISRSLSWWD